MFKGLKEVLPEIKEMWINSLPVDPRQKKFAVIIGVLDLLAFSLVFAGLLVPGAICFTLMLLFVFVARRMSKKWKHESEKEHRNDGCNSNQ